MVSEVVVHDTSIQEVVPFTPMTYDDAVRAAWTVGGVASGPLHLGWVETRDSTLRRPVVTPIATGVGVFGLFYAAALVARRIPVLDSAISHVLLFADEETTGWCC